MTNHYFEAIWNLLFISQPKVNSIVIESPKKYYKNFRNQLNEILMLQFSFI